MIVWTWGYRGGPSFPPKSHEQLRRHIAEQGITRIIDVRRSPQGEHSNPYWHRSALVDEFGDLYEHVPEFGRGTWPGQSPDHYAHPAHEKAAALARAGEDIILICAEDNARDCHRLEVARLIAHLAGGEVRNLR